MPPGGVISSVALVSEHASPIAALGHQDAGGQNIYVAALAEEFGRRGIDVAVYTRRDDPALPRRVCLAQNVVLEYVDAGPPVSIARDAILPLMRPFGEQLRRAWRRWRPDIVHAHYWMSGIAALHAAAPLGIPIVQTFHALGATKRRHLGANDSSPLGRVRIETELASMVDAVVATSGDELLELRRCGARPQLAKVVPCGVDTALFKPATPHYPQGRRVVVVGRLVVRKGIDDIIRSLTRLPDVRLVVAGGSGKAGDPDAGRLVRLASQLGVADRVELIGPLKHNLVPGLLRSADVVACVPWYEPFGMVALEAMACAAPVVASAVGGLRETVVHGETGLHVPPRDPTRLAETLQTLLDDGGLRAQLGARAAARAASLYSWRRVADSLLLLYARAAERRSP